MKAIGIGEFDLFFPPFIFFTVVVYSTIQMTNSNLSLAKTNKQQKPKAKPKPTPWDKAKYKISKY